MDSSRNIILPTLICLTIAVVYYMKFYPKKSKQLTDKSKSEKKENENESQSKLRGKKEDNTNSNNNLDEDNKEEDNIEEEKEKEKNFELTYNILFDKFCDYIQKNKLVSIEAISQKLKKTKEDTIKFLRELENEGKTVGFLGADGEYFYLTTKELDLLNKILLNSKNKVISEEELEKQFKQIIHEGQESIF